MSRLRNLKQLDKRIRNQLRSILAAESEDALLNIQKLRNTLNEKQAAAVEEILCSPSLVKSTVYPVPFPSRPPFRDLLFPPSPSDIHVTLNFINDSCSANHLRLVGQIDSLHVIDSSYASGNYEKVINDIVMHVEVYGWSHALLRRMVLIRDATNEENKLIEELLHAAGLHVNSMVVSSLIHAYAEEQDQLTIKRSTLNVFDKGIFNRYSRALSRINFQPFSNDADDFATFLGEVSKCSLIDAAILANFNKHLFNIFEYKAIQYIGEVLNRGEAVHSILKKYVSLPSGGESLFYKHCGVWLEYSLIRQYRMLIDFYYDPSSKDDEIIPSLLKDEVNKWIIPPTLSELISGDRLTQHNFESLAEMEDAGVVTRSAIFNYWLISTDGQIPIASGDLALLMGKTRDLAKTVPIQAARTAVQMSNDKTVKFILLLLLAKRSKNERDSYQLKSIMTNLIINDHGGSLVSLVESFATKHPAIAEYIYDITTEDFLAKLTQVVPHLSDIPETRAKLHEWMAEYSGDGYFLERARAVRVDHQLNRVRNEIDDHRVYVDPSRFASWINDEVMADLNAALTTTGSSKKHGSVSCDEVLLSSIIRLCYSTFCSNAIFGISSYIGRRIRHGTFRGHLYSGIVNHMESNQKFRRLLADPNFVQRWSKWKEKYDAMINEIISDKLHVQSRNKTKGLLQPDNFGAQKSEILAAAVKTISFQYSETKSTEGVVDLIMEFCWRLAEHDLRIVIDYLKSRQNPLKQTRLLDEMAREVSAENRGLVTDFRRELHITVDKKLRAMYSWFKRPSNVSPNTSLSLLYSAVVAEVRDSFPGFNPENEEGEFDSVELVGGVYHMLYDSFYVVVFNAAKYGDPKKPVRKKSTIISTKTEKRLVVEITSSIMPDQDPERVSQIIEQRKNVNFDDANLYDRRSGIPKLMQLAHTRKEFVVEFMGVIANDVVVRLSYALAY